jgi:hypothetical protein
MGELARDEKTKEESSDQANLALLDVVLEPVASGANATAIDGTRERRPTASIGA